MRVRGAIACVLGVLLAACGAKKPQAPADVAVIAESPPPLPEGVPPPQTAKIVLQGVNFDFGRAKIRPEDVAVLDEAARLLSRNERVTILVGGHTDDLGAAAYNQRLSERRAASVRDYLVDKGIADSRISVAGYGESKPVASNRTREGRAQNRRVVIDVARPPGESPAAQ
jgi:OOP family OmpA-OmpF porin